MGCLDTWPSLPPLSKTSDIEYTFSSSIFLTGSYVNNLDGGNEVNLFQQLPEYLTNPGMRQATPIGAMYESELYHYDSTIGLDLQMGNPNNSNGYWGSTYGPYTQYNNANQYGQNGLLRIKEVYRQYYNNYILQYHQSI